jgi:hypothetical protein
MADAPRTLALTEEETNNLREIVLLYKKVKKLMIEVEEWNDKKAFAPTLLELRSSLDHQMRFYAYKFGYKTEVQENYSEKNLFKSKGHLFRAGYDSLDYLSIEITESILERVEPFSTEAISKAIPEYFSKIRPEMDEISGVIADIRVEKDMDNKNSQDFDRHIEAISRLRSYHTEIQTKINSLVEFEGKRKSEIQSASYRELKLLVEGAVIGGVVLLVIEVIFKLAI